MKGPSMPMAWVTSVNVPLRLLRNSLARLRALVSGSGKKVRNRSGQPSLSKSIQATPLQTRMSVGKPARAVTQVAVDGHRGGWVVGDDDDVEQAVVVEVFHDGAALHVEAIDAGEMADVAEFANVEFGLEKSIEIDAEPGIDLVGKFTQGHV